jgi:pimeloyl-ACP methyl ester carboxylesterase
VTNLELPDGRTLEYVVDGPAEGLPMVLHHGTPSAAVLFEPMVSAAARHGLRTVMHSRPGYAGSSAQPGRSVAAVAGDVTAVLDELGADRFVTVGWSGGGPHALACAALLPERCEAAASIAGVAPYDGEGLDWFAGMGAENIEEFGAAAAGEPQLVAYLAAAAPGLAGVQPAELVAELGDLVSEVDRKALTGDFAEYLAASCRASLATGIAGWRDDDLAFLADWGYRLAGIRTPVSVWQGAEDRMVPFDHGRWLAAHLPAATVHLEPAEGHLSLLFNRFDAVVAELTTHVR